MAVDWSLYDSDIVRLYIRENKSAEAVISFLRTTYNVNISTRQFKRHYGGRKNIQAHEWRAVIEAIRKRESESKKSEVYVNNRKVNRSHVQRAIHLYEKSNDGRSSTGIDIGIETINKKRIEIRTPGAQVTNTSALSDPEVECVISSTHAEDSRDSLRIIPIPEGVFFEDMNLENIEMDFGTPTTLSLTTFNNIQTFDSRHALPRISSPISLDISAINDGSQMVLSNCPWKRISPHDCPMLWPRPESFASLLPTSSSAPDPALEITQFFWDLPEIRVLFPFLVDGTILPNIRESQIPDTWSCCQESAWPPTDELSSFLISVHPNLEPLRTTMDQLQVVLDSWSRTYSMSDEARYHQKSKFEHQILAVITYLASNIMIEGYLNKFIEGALKSGYSGLLVDFLGMKSPYVRILATEIVKWFLNNSHFKRNGIFNRYQNESLSLLQAADPRIFSGDIGFQLLQRAIRHNNLQVVKFIIRRAKLVSWDEDDHEALIDAWQTPLDFGYNSRPDRIRILQLLLCTNTTANGFKYAACLESALQTAIRFQDFEEISILLRAGAKLSFDALRHGELQTQKLYAALNNSSVADEILKIKCLIEAASKGSRRLSQFMFEHDIFQDHILEQALCIATDYEDLAAVRTLLSHGVDPDASKFRAFRLAQGTKELSEHECAINEEECEIREDAPLFCILRKPWSNKTRSMIYLLRRAGARLNPERFQRLCRTNRPGDFGKVAWALAAVGFDITLVGPIALNYAAGDGDDDDEGRIDECGLLLDAGCPINEYGLGGLSALQEAARRGDLALVHFLLERGANVNLPASDDGGRTALQAGAELGDIDVVECLLDAGADVNAPPAKNDGLTVLEAAATDVLCNVLFKKLLCAGAPIKHPDGAGDLSQSIIRGSLDLTKCLELALNAGASTEGLAEVDTLILSAALTPLQTAAYFLNLDAVRTLLSHGANINAPASPNSGFTALQAAAGCFPYPTQSHMEKQIELVTFLLHQNADVNAPHAEKFGRTALQSAITAPHPNPRVIELLLEHGADVNAPPAEIGGVTALQGAAIKGDLRTARLLLGRRAKVNAPAAPEEGRTAIEGAAEHGRLEMLRFLLANGAMPISPNGFSRAIKLAEDNDRWQIADMLRECERTASVHWPSSS